MIKAITVFGVIFTSILLFTSCEKNDSSDKKETTNVEMSFYAYTKYTPSSFAHKTSAKFFFFDASEGQKFMEERIEIPSGGYIDYSKANCEMTTLLNNNEFELSDGTRIQPISIKYGSSTHYYISIIPDIQNADDWHSLLSNNIINIPEGEYYIVALLGTWDLGYGYQKKYSGKYVEVKEGMNNDDKTISINFPHDTKHKGFIDWITTNW